MKYFRIFGFILLFLIIENIVALEGIFVDPEGLQIILEFRKTKVKVTMASFPMPVWYNYSTWYI